MRSKPAGGARVVAVGLGPGRREGAVREALDSLHWFHFIFPPDFLLGSSKPLLAIAFPNR